MSKDSSLYRVWEGLKLKKLFSETIMDKIFEINFIFHVKQGTTGRVLFLFLSNICLVLAKFLF